MPESLLLHSPLGILSMHAHMPGLSFKSLGVELEPRLTMWESTSLTTTSPAGPVVPTFYFILLMASSSLSFVWESAGSYNSCEFTHEEAYL